MPGPTSQVSGDGSSPLHIAAMNGHFDLAMLLLEGGADPNVATDAGAPPLCRDQCGSGARRAVSSPRAQDQQKVAYRS